MGSALYAFPLVTPLAARDRSRGVSRASGPPSCALLSRRRPASIRTDPHETASPAFDEERENLEDALEVVRAYTLRWRIERLHYTTKTGAGHLHESQLRSFDALAKWITLHVAVASRLQHILYRSRDEPDVPADQEFSRDEIEATLLLREQEYSKTYPTDRTPSLGELVLFIAELGGYMGLKRSGGPPGIKIFERAFLRVEAASLAVAALHARARAQGGTHGSNG